MRIAHKLGLYGELKCKTKVHIYEVKAEAIIHLRNCHSNTHWLPRGIRFEEEFRELQGHEGLVVRKRGRFDKATVFHLVAGFPSVLHLLRPI